MTQHPGQNDPDEGEDFSKGQSPGETGGPANTPGLHPTRPLGSTPNDPRGPGQATGHGSGQPGQNPSHPGQPPHQQGQSGPGQSPNQPGPSGQGPYGQPTTPPQQGPGSGYGSSGYGYGQQGGYSGPGQPGPGQPGQGHPGSGGQYSGQPYQQPYPQQNAGAPRQSTSPENKNFFAALFDFSFQSFVTVKFAKFIYAILIAFLALAYLFVVVVAFSDGAAEGMIVLLLGWIPAAIYLILIRISLEFMIALVRTSQNTAGTRTEIEALRSELKNRR